MTEVNAPRGRPHGGGSALEHLLVKGSSGPGALGNGSELTIMHVSSACLQCAHITRLLEVLSTTHSTR